jgi:hypothetical protein
MRSMFRSRPRPWRAALALVASAVFLCSLFLPARDDDNLSFFLDWRPEIEPLLIIGALAALALAGRRLSAPLRWTAAILIFIAALLQFGDAAVLGVFDRELDLYFDLPHVPQLLALFYQAAGFWRGVAVIAAAGLGVLALVTLIAAVLAAIERAMKPPRFAAACLGSVVALAATAPIGWFATGESMLGERTLPVIGRQAARLYRAYAVMHGLDDRYAEALAAPQPPAGALPGLKRRDVYIVFFESYGTVALDDPRYARTIGPALQDFAATVSAAGWHLRSGRIVSPTFGGGSWLAHGTIDAGLRLDALLTRLIVDSPRQTLPRYMAAAGYRSIEIMPGVKSPEPEHGFWGFDKSYYAVDLGYQGPPFGWFDIPDQYTLRRLGEIENRAGRRPLFAQIVLVSSHTPFVPVPPYVADWRAGDLYRDIPQDQWDRIYAPPDWSRLEAPYADSVVYDLKTLAAWLAQLDGDALVVILGDHQPPGFISGEKQPWTVPIHVVSRDADLLRPFAALGYVDGALPPRGGEVKGMESFLGDFLRGYAQAPTALATKPETTGEVPD